MEERSFYLFHFISFNRLDFFVYMINFLAVIFFSSQFYVLYYVLSLCFSVSLYQKLQSSQADFKSFLFQN